MNGRMHARMCYVAYMDKVVYCVKSASKGFWLGGEDGNRRDRQTGVAELPQTHNSQAAAQEKRTGGMADRALFLPRA